MIHITTILVLVIYYKCLQFVRYFKEYKNRENIMHHKQRTFFRGWGCGVEPKIQELPISVNCCDFENNKRSIDAIVTVTGVQYHEILAEVFRPANQDTPESCEQQDEATTTIARDTMQLLIGIFRETESDLIKLRFQLFFQPSRHFLKNINVPNAPHIP